MVVDSTGAIVRPDVVWAARRAVALEVRRRLRAILVDCFIVEDLLRVDVRNVLDLWTIKKCQSREIDLHLPI